MVIMRPAAARRACRQTLAISVRTSNTTCSILRRVARSPRDAHRAGRLDRCVSATPQRPSSSSLTSSCRPVRARSSINLNCSISVLALT